MRTSLNLSLHTERHKHAYNTGKHIHFRTDLILEEYFHSVNSSAFIIKNTQKLNTTVQIPSVITTTLFNCDDIVKSAVYHDRD